MISIGFLSLSAFRKLSSFLCVGLLAGLAVPTVAGEPEADAHEDDARVWRSPELAVAPSLENADLSLLRKADADHPAVRFFAERGGQWRITNDTRSGRPHLIEGSGLPILPGKGNGLSAEELGWAEKALGVESVARHLRQYLARAPDVLGIDGLDLRLDLERSLVYGDDDYLWLVELQQFHDGLKVEGARAFFRINHGNLVQVGTDRLADVRVDTLPTLTDAMAWESALAELGHAESNARLFRDSELLIVPVALAGERPGFAYTGRAGQGYAHRLVWRFLYSTQGREGIHGEYRLSVDAHSGEILENVSLGSSATVTGGVYPTTNADPLVTVELPHVTVQNNGAKTTDSNGEYNYTGGTATAGLRGPYVSVTDWCGGISLSNSSTGDLAFGGAAGTNCDTPGIGGAGNTNAARTAFYHLNRINRKAVTFFSPGSAPHNWLNDTLDVEVNKSPSGCNGGWSYETESIYFYYPSGNCSNAGEIPDFHYHEWGHGMDANAGGTPPEKGTEEATADTFTLLETRDACIFDNLYPGTPCYNCRSSCTGSRDLDSLAWGGVATLAHPSTVEDDTGLACHRDIRGCPQQNAGPMGYQRHCESQIASTANLDLIRLLVDEYGSAGWDKMEDIWYASLVPAGSAYRVASGGTCNPSAAVDGCGSDNWYKLYLVADDDDGNLVNGTPNACRIWDAFNTHGIACGDRPVCSGEAPGCIQQPTGLRAFWPLDEHIGVEAAEMVSSLEGTYVNGPEATVGKVLNGHEFDGADDYVTVPNSSVLNLGTGDFSLAAWIKTTTTSGTIVSKREHTNGQYVGYLFMVYYGRPLLQISDTANGYLNYTSTAMPLVNDGDWHHVAVTVDRNSSTGGRFYIDGSLVHTFNPTGRQGTISNASALTIGRASNSSSSYLRADLDEVQLYNRSLHSSVIASLYNAGDGVCRLKPLSVSLQCADLGHKYTCSATTSGGEGGNAYSWSVNGGATFLYTNGPSAELDYSSCTPGTFATVSVNVTDSGGNSKTAFDQLECGGLFPF